MESNRGSIRILDEQSARIAGVGLALSQHGETGVVTIKSIAPGASADRSRRLAVGDELISVEGVHVQSVSHTELRERIVGVEGTLVTLAFKKSSGDVIEIELMRGSADFIASIHAPPPELPPLPPVVDRSSLTQSLPSSAFGVASSSAASDEVLRLRATVRQLEATNARYEEDVRLLRSSLEAQRSEFDARLRAAEEDFRRQLNDRNRADDVVRAAELSRQEAEGRALEAKRREQRLLEELRRMFEKEQLRLEYIDDLKRRHEDDKNSLGEEMSALQEALRKERAKRADAEAGAVHSEQRFLALDHIVRERIEREGEYRRAFDGERVRLMDAFRQTHLVAQLLSEAEASLSALERDALPEQRVFDSSALLASLALGPRASTPPPSFRGSDIVMA